MAHRVAQSRTRLKRLSAHNTCRARAGGRGSPLRETGACKGGAAVGREPAPGSACGPFLRLVQTPSFVTG